jgi:hypothetical protein
MSKLRLSFTEMKSLNHLSALQQADKLDNDFAVFYE